MIQLLYLLFNSKFNISCPSIVLCIAHIRLFFMKQLSNVFFVSVKYFSFSVNNVPSFDFIHPIDEHIFYPVVSVIHFYVFLSILSISAHILFSHSIFTSIHVFLISLCNMLCSVPQLRNFCILFYIIFSI